MAGSRSLPTFVKGWLALSAAICTWDGGYILFRPHSGPNGSLHWLWKPYALYIQIDTRYGDMADTFVYAVAVLNVVEIGLNLLVLCLSSMKSRHTVPLAFTVTTMTFWKTVVYLLQYMSFVDGGRTLAHNSLINNIFLFWIPNGIWVTVPFLVMCMLFPRLSEQQSSRSKRE